MYTEAQLGLQSPILNGMAIKVNIGVDPVAVQLTEVGIPFIPSIDPLVTEPVRSAVGTPKLVTTVGAAAPAGFTFARRYPTFGAAEHATWKYTSVVGEETP